MREPTIREVIRARWKEIGIGRVPKKRELYRAFRDELLSGKAVRVNCLPGRQVQIQVREFYGYNVKKMFPYLKWD